MPDFILADMICDLIKVTGKQLKKTLDWYGCDSVGHLTENLKVKDKE